MNSIADSIVADSSATQIAPTAQAISTWLSARIAATLKIQPSQVDPDITFDRYGLDSMQAVSVTGDLGDGLGLEELPPTLLYDYPTINQLAAHLADTVRVNH
jgi:acyl carrier protein